MQLETADGGFPVAMPDSLKMSSRAESYESLLNDSDEPEQDVDDSSPSDTDEASETDTGKGEEYMEIKEQMFQDKLATLKKQLQQLKDGTHAECNKANRILEEEKAYRVMMNNVNKSFLMDILERGFISEVKAAARECEEKRVELKDSLISEYEEKRRAIETERASTELVGDSNESKPAMTRKLRRRPNDPLPVPEKRRKAPPAQINLLADEKDVESDLKHISRGRPLTPQIRRPPISGGIGLPPPPQSDSSQEPRIEDGKLRYEKRFYHRGQPVYVTDRDNVRFAANIHNIGPDAVWAKKVSDSAKVRIPLTHLAKKKVHIERRVP